jgi:hypothetical protein
MRLTAECSPESFKELFWLIRFYRMSLTLFPTAEDIMTNRYRIALLALTFTAGAWSSSTAHANAATHHGADLKH